jgi:hypothetical protein
MKSDDPWTVYGRIVGECLPSKQIKLDNIHLGPLPVGIALRDRADRPSFTFGQPMPSTCVSDSADTRVQSSCYFWLTKRAKTPTEAIDIVEREDLSRLQAVLSAHAAEQPYRFEVLCAERNKFFQAAPSAMARCRFFAASELPSTNIANAHADMIFLAQNPKVSAVFRHFGDATRQNDTAATSHDQESALLSAFKVIEGIAQLVHVPISAEALEDEQREIAKKLSPVLQTDSAIAVKVKAIRDARNQLDRLEIRFLDLKIWLWSRTWDYQPNGRTQQRVLLIFGTNASGIPALLQHPPSAIPG